MQQMNEEGMSMQMAGASMPTAKKESKGMMLGMVFCSVLAIAGIGFGVYEMTQANSVKQQISDLKIEIKNDDGTTTTLETDKIEVKEDDKTIIINNPEVDANAKGYIYLSELGIKIKNPQSNITNEAPQDGSIIGLSYAFNGHNLHIWATVYRDGDQGSGFGVMDNFGKESKIITPYLATIVMGTEAATQCRDGEAVGELNGNKICYLESKDEVLSQSYGSDMDKHVRPAVQALKAHFTDMSNYSKM